MFDNITVTKLGFYVYALVNPLTNKVFYIGKGIDNRVFAHKQEVLENKGWKIHRIWGYDWLENRNEQLEKIKNFL